MRDMDARAFGELRALQDRCAERFVLRGYARVETPIIEETELFLRKSGGELASQLYSFTDPGGFAVSLRPEYTAPVIRHAIEESALDQLPIRIQYAGPIFRYPVAAEASEVRSGVFTQVGAELIGGRAPLGDAEVIGMALEGLRAVGIEEPRVAVGHVGLIWNLLSTFGLSDRARLFLVSSIGALARGEKELVRAQAKELGLLPFDGSEPRSAEPREEVEKPDSEEMVRSVLGHALGDTFGGLTASRQPYEIVARLAQKMRTADDPEAVEAALELLEALSGIRGHADRAIAQAYALLGELHRSPAPLEEVEAVPEALEAEGIRPQSVLIDFGLARGIAYYTGAVFDLLSPRGVSLGGGGRYDGLPRALGADRDVPALGFAYTLEAVVNESRGSAAGGDEAPAAVLVVPSGEDARRAAKEHAAALRSEGIVSIEDSPRRSREGQRRYAAAHGALRIDRVEADGRAESETL